SDDEISQICESLIKNNIDGVIATNTTLDRTVVEGMKHSNEAGGLSGRPVQSRSTEVVRKLHEELGDKLPIIGVGGVDSYVAAKEKMMAGAQLVQVYTGFIYHGPSLVRDIVKNL
ncbi:quinone-dependent dihydroorotate dehydrogenase, partial [Vibrio owensii]